MYIYIHTHLYKHSPKMQYMPYLVEISAKFPPANIPMTPRRVNDGEKQAKSQQKRPRKLDVGFSEKLSDPLDLGLGLGIRVWGLGFRGFHSKTIPIQTDPKIPLSVFSAPPKEVQRILGTPVRQGGDLLFRIKSGVCSLLGILQIPMAE